jgi:chromosome segregation ATPase
MSNHSHLHEVEIDGAHVSVDAFGTREECDICRAKAGLPPIEEVRAQLAALQRGETIVTMRGGQAPDEELLADLEAAEATITELRAQLKDAAPAIARERDDALAQVGQLGRQLQALERQLEAIPQLEAQLTTSRARVAELEAAAAKPKK